MATITAENGMLVLRSSYDQLLVQSIKNLPFTDRRWDPTRKVWMIDPKHGQTLVAWIGVYLGENTQLPQTQSADLKKATQIFQVRYIGACKTRDDSSSSAFGLVGDDWSLIFPESVLRAWFDSEQDVSETMNLYQILGVRKSSTQDEIRSSFRRMARQWHPDVCCEPNAHEMFIRIQEAHTILSDQNKRVRYDAGLVFEQQLQKKQTKAFMNLENYRSPLRCGFIMAEGFNKLGRFEVSKILAWEDIVQNGRTLVVSWPMGADKPVEMWT
jgi:hypothetical protein